MRPTTSTMLQQNNNNNYPCLNMSGSTREMLQKCSRASLPFPSRLELGLGDLPLIRGLRAWALCSKNRRKASGMLGGQAPTAPPAGRGGPTSCPRPADVYLSGEWGRMGYGLPLGLDAGQAGIGALVTVATLKTSEGSGKTQTQCLFLRTEKGSCLYSTAKPGPGATTGAASSVVGGWLRGKTGGGSKDTPAGRRDHGPTPLAQTGANRVRVRSGRRWRKSCNAAGREKTGASRERQQSSSREDPAGESALEERQEERDKGGLDSKQFPSPQQDIRKAKQEKDGAFRSPRCCHNASPKTCTHCGRRAQRRESQDEHEGGESPRRGVPNKLNGEVKGMRKERQKNEEEEKGGLGGLESSNSVFAVPNPDLESNHFHPESHSSRDVEETSEAESKPQTSHSKDSSEKEEDTDSEGMKLRTDADPHSDQVTDDFLSRHNRESDDRKPSENPREDTAAHVNGFFEAHQESEGDVESADVEEEEGSVNQTPAELSVVSTCSLGNHAIAGESTHWTPGWTDSSFSQSDDTWTAFPQDSPDERRDVAGQWWPTSAVEESRDRLLANQNLASVFAEAFPSLPGSSSCDLDTVPTLTQLLRGKASQDQGLLDSFHDLNKMICQRYKRANGASRDLLLKTLHLEQPHTESRSALRTANRRLSPGLPSANQHAQNAAAKRRLSYDYNRNIME
ncbi:hypothetical protein GBF38_012003 [Nibea albiflora]|uniref:Uncharacterized protein n=1 Tax=Nibea albiflora TaxID=240163 RepID=A0ACB7EJ42_NIBAL|nr:hypothetical protein GBF38_012003 [Nibea albiflora]